MKLIGYQRFELIEIEGVYKITNTVSKKVYIGSAVNLADRYSDHKSTVKGNKHVNSHLQNSYNFHGEAAFTFEIIEFTHGNRKEREDYWIAFYDATEKTKGYNILKSATVSTEEIRERLSRSLLGHVVTDETRQKIGDKNRGKKHTPEVVEKRAQAMKGRKPAKSTIEAGKKFRAENPDFLAEINKVSYSFTNPEGVVYEGIGIKDFALQMGLDPKGLNHVHTGKNKSHQGWTKTGGEKAGRYIYKLVSPEGVLHTFNGNELGTFCDLHGLNINCIRDVRIDKITNHKGWHKPGVDIKKRGRLKFKLKSPSGEIIEASNMSEFCRANNLLSGNLYQVIQGQRKSHRGWTRAE